MSRPYDQEQPDDEVITYDPENPDTYPSVCHTPEDIQARFGMTGGEQFTVHEIDRWILDHNDKPAFVRDRHA